MVRDFAAVASFGILLLATGCGGGGDGASFTAANVQAITVDPGPANNVNLLFTTVTICAPGNPFNCQSIDHVLVDTGSTGLRVMSSLLSPSLLLRQQTDASGNPVVECGQFASGYTWGSVKVADVKMSGEQAGSVPIQVMGDPAFSVVPASCSSVGPALNSVQALGANGLLGVGVFQQDCGPACALNVIPGTYFICPATGCQPAQASLTQQVQNPVGMFSRDNNGVIIALPSVPVTGAVSVSGSMIFGIGTQGNNGLGNARVILVDPNTATFTTVRNAVTYSNSFIDSGSNALFFADPNIATCNTAVGFYCPASTQSLSATNQGAGGTASMVVFRVANAESLFAANPTFAAMGNLAGTNSDATSFDWGLPFLFGRNVFTAIEGQNTSAGFGPYVAY
ncbi:MAG: DUF3443 domain-containing protein [Betaproteobacteria bacterium]|nr:DUF3443 domain-containing protein [Betaproteobacteria bacterium]